MNIANFEVDKTRCVGCGKCVKVCPGGLLYIDENHKATISDFSTFGWNGCWQCEHCLAVCPKAAINVLGHKPENSILPVDINITTSVMDAIIVNRHSCRRYQNRNVDVKIIDDMIVRLANAPNGGNKQQVEFTLIDNKEQMDIFRSLAYSEMERLAEQGIFPEGFDKAAYEDMKHWEDTVRPDMLFCGAPHILIPHAPMKCGQPKQDVLIVGTYFELLCASRGLGAVMLTFPLGVLERIPEVKAMLQIPKDHYIGMIIGFGYPEIKYSRGVQKRIKEGRIHRLNFDKAVK